MPWDVHVLHSVALLVLLQGPEINGMSQESIYVIECIRDMIPMQIFNECCMRENNCTATRQQNKGIDCMSRMIISNYSSYFSDSHDGGPATTESSYQHNNHRNHRWYGDVIETLAEICRRQPRSRMQTCVRNELIKRCRYSMLQDRITSPPGRWNQRRDYPYYNDRSGGDGYMDPPRRFYQNYGNRRNQGNFGYSDRNADYGDARSYSRGNYNNEDMDEEDFGYSNDDSMRYR